MQSNEAAANLIWRFGLLPFGCKSNLAAFIARHDPWYCRHVYIPFVESNLVLPWVERSSQSLQRKEQPSTPAQLLQRQVEMYMQEAQQVRPSSPHISNSSDSSYPWLVSQFVACSVLDWCVHRC